MNSILWDNESVLSPMFLPHYILLTSCDFCFLYFLHSTTFLALLAKHDSGELCCPATALILKSLYLIRPIYIINISENDGYVKQ